MGKPKHPKAVAFLESGIFEEIGSFAELEERIALLPSEVERGDVFEVFAEACLATQRIFQATSVWPGNSVPVATRRRLNLMDTDMGVDGVFESSTETLTCYQVKFRSNRRNLRWADLSTFVGLSERSPYRLIFTNCDRIANEALTRDRVLTVRGSDLDSLMSDDFKMVRNWIAGALVRPQPKIPRRHQKAAIGDIVHGLQSCERVTALMACGTGKTLVALWVAERLNAKTVLILLPSLALVRQTLREWLRETNWESPEFICVCSDSSVQESNDALIVRPSELSFPVTTEPSVVRQFLSRRTQRVRLVFATYHSSEVVGKALSDGDSFDLGFFDEALKTAGRTQAKFSHALSDENVRIRRRLFMTATPRHYDVLHKDSSGASKVVYSMDLLDDYGPTVHTLPFTAAAELGIICDYQIVISVVTSEMVTNEALNRGVVLVEGDEIRARQVANQIAIKAAIEKYGARKVFTFHTKVQAAQSFTSKKSDGIGNHLSGFVCEHIEGRMPTAKRESLLQQFAEAHAAILSNARCLTEGVDVPAVDMVAFLSPKRSLVDIVQATGRAMRRSPGKKTGYVLVPLFVEKAQGETITEAVMRSNFDEVWKVLQGIKEQDEMLAQTISNMRVEIGQTGGFNDTNFREKVEVIGPELSLEELRRTIATACIQKVGDPWFERYGQLLSYREEHGNCDVPKRYERDTRLGLWVVQQRFRRRKGFLSSERIKLLDEVGFNWDPRDTKWTTNYVALVDFKRRFGHCRVPQNWPENRSLAQWVSGQRFDYSQDELTEERIALLADLGFEWRVMKATWEDRFNELLKYKERTGNTRVPARSASHPRLSTWVVAQRYKHRKGKLAREYVEQLESIGFEWEIPRQKQQRKGTGPYNQEKWNESFEELKRYYSIHGVGPIDHDTPARKRLAVWTQYPRKLYRAGTLSKERVHALVEIGFDWEGRRRGGGPSDNSRITENEWATALAALVDFRKRQGHCNVLAQLGAEDDLLEWAKRIRDQRLAGNLSLSQAQQLDELEFSCSRYDGDWEKMFTLWCQSKEGRKLNATSTKKLASWKVTQRQSRKNGKLSSAREHRLTENGFDWAPHESSWDRMFQRLAAYSDRYGSCQVPQNWKKDPTLGHWVAIQRSKQREGQLSASRFRKLDDLGFLWTIQRSRSTERLSIHDQKWLKMFEELRAYRDLYGHTNVPQTSKEDPKLGSWVCTQRSSFRKGKLSNERIDLLDSLEFVWSFSKGRLEGASTGSVRTRSVQRWKEMVQELAAYKAIHGNCRVTQESKDHRQLGQWVSRVRTDRRAGRVSAEKIRTLDELGFDWNPIGDRWEEMFAELVAFKEIFGHTNVPQRKSEYSALANWVGNQRAAKRLGRPIVAERAERLEALGFVWNMVVKSWEEMYAKLVSYHQQHGNADVPQKYKDDPILGRWVDSQRSSFKNGELPEDRQRKLDALGFSWNLQRSRRARMNSG